MGIEITDETEEGNGEERFFGWGGSSSSSSSSSSEEESQEWWNNWKNAAKVQYLAYKCGEVAKNMLSGSDVARIVNIFKPMVNKKLSNQDVLTMSNEMNHYKSKIQKLADCIGQKSGWGRRTNERGIEVPKALSIGVAVGAGKYVSNYLQTLITGSIFLGYQHFFLSFKNRFSPAAGASGSGEVGVAIDITNGAIIGYTGACAGVATELQSPAGSVVVGVWNELSDIPGTSYALEVGLDFGDILTVGIIKISPSMGIVLNDSGSYIGTTLAFTLGGPGDPSFLDISAHICHTVATDPL